MGWQMSIERILQKDGFFKFLVSLEDLKVKKEKILFISTLGITEEDLVTYLEIMKNFEINIKLDKNFIYPISELESVKISLSFSEWIALQLTIDNEKNVDNYFNKILRNKIELIQKANSKYSLYKLISQKNEKSNVSMNELGNDVKKIEFYISNKSTIKLNFSQDRFCEIFPLRLVFLDGALCVIGEDIHDKTLSYFALSDLVSIEEKKIEYVPSISQIEVNEFIIHLRLVSGNEERLILKIYSTFDAELIPQNHFLGNPFVTSNSDGDFIWAASIEMCEEVYQWLYSLKDKIEILDPGHVKKEFDHFCEIKKGYPTFKKVS
jgi:hypothetical protein